MAAERKINLRVEYEGPHDANTVEASSGDGRKIYGPWGTGRVKDMILWGDKTRILQVIINLTSNALKFTPEGGSVLVVVRCTGFADMARKESFGSRQNTSSGRNSRSRVYSNTSELSAESSLRQAIGPGGSSVRTNSPPPHSRELMFEFEVRDSGPGVPLALQEKIFEPFFQGDMQLSKKYSGTGLGLSICKQLAALMQGSISLQSDGGEASGSAFTMRIPLRHIASRANSTTSSASNASPRASMDEKMDGKGQDKLVTSAQGFPGPDLANAPPRLVGLSAPFFAVGKSSEEAEATKEGGRRLRILIAEDNKTNQTVLVKMLRIEKIFNVDVAEGWSSCIPLSWLTLADGKEALDLVKKSMEDKYEYNLVFMDVQMPNMDGLEATQLIRESGFARPIVALSAYSDDTNIKACKAAGECLFRHQRKHLMSAGTSDFVSKPIQLARLRLVMQTYCPDEEPATTPPATAVGAATTPPGVAVLASPGRTGSPARAASPVGPTVATAVARARGPASPSSATRP
jgi:osomolarity two-component system sensor histidine kinase SLN1